MRGPFTTRSSNLLATAMLLSACVPALAQAPPYDVGRAPTEEELRAWDITPGPPGRELPPGSGTASAGAKIYAQKCAACHGPTGAEGPAAPALVGANVSLGTWPFATTIWEYINRAMPRGQEGSLQADEVYSVTAFLLHKNGITQESDVMDAQSLPKFQMPNRARFVPPEPGWKPRERRPFGMYLSERQD